MPFLSNLIFPLLLQATTPGSRVSFSLSFFFFNGDAWLLLTSPSTHIRRIRVLMGSGGSKNAPPSPSHAAIPGRSRRPGGSAFSCLGASRKATLSSDDHRVSVTAIMEAGEANNVKYTDRKKRKPYFRDEQSLDGIHDISSEAPTSTISADATQTRCSQSCTRFGFNPGKIGTRLCQAASLGSSGYCSIFYRKPLELHYEESIHENLSSDSSNNLTRSCDGNNVLSRHPFQSSGMSGLGLVFQDQQTASSSDGSTRSTGTIPALNSQGYSERMIEEINPLESRLSVRQMGWHEHIEGSMRFSRARSVGRLRDRVLCRSSSTDGFISFLQEDRAPSEFRLSSMWRLRESASRGASSSRDDERAPPSSHCFHVNTSRSGNNNLNYDPLGSRVTGNGPRVEHQTTFLERRRRLRSQVRALQRLGSRFENLSVHNQSCILSGQHRTGQCMCQASSRASSQNRDTNTRASISRIVMLAEALFEVLDEIHQQSAVFSSQSSVSSLGSVPAPKEVVDCIPVKIYRKPSKYGIEETAQCYICLIEYEEGDFVRMLPCHHDFHQTCIDKWLKEIHRVCPLCRRDICHPDLPQE